MFRLEKKGRNYSIDEVLPYVIVRDKVRVDFHGDMIKMGSHRLQTFALYGVKCVTCGIEGKYFTKDRSTGSKKELYHLNLYAIGDDGDEILITKDHIIPRSKGGADSIENYQTMCLPCNMKKKDSVVGRRNI